MGLINYSNESNASPYIAKEESKWIPLFICVILWKENE